MAREKLLYGVDYAPHTKAPAIRDIVCSECGGMLEDKPKNEGLKWTSSPNNLYCPNCNIEWVV